MMLFVVVVSCLDFFVILDLEIGDFQESSVVVFGSVLEVLLTHLSRLSGFEILVLSFERSALIVIGRGRCYLRVGRKHSW
ncbi:predicted protein [Arabidopsis lyrata subsp. lyrata]|uniref:Predicted protein n=1 Tax=Arabidopsis lyrata subsp. lyrata TaxID=81972 RepID=D7LCQ0_ARALL|nr:predicted protein [Arabidopsis lyrata subsp. lyrata]